MASPLLLPSRSSQAGDLTLVDGRFLDPETGRVIEGDLVIKDGTVIEIGIDVARVGRQVDLGGRTVIPGLIDAHLHAYASEIGGIEVEVRPLSYVALKAVHRLGDALQRGFTTVRDVAGGDSGLAAAIAEGLFASPRYLYTGPALSQTGGHGDPRPVGLDVCYSRGHSTELVDGVDDLRRAVRRRFHDGAHAIKVMASGGVVSPADPLRNPQYSAEEIGAVTDEARRRGSYVAAHAYSPEAIRHAVENGVRSIEHGNLLDTETAALMAAHDAYLVPTLAAYDATDRRGDEVGLEPFAKTKNDEVLAAGKTAVVLARRAGVRIGFGSDLMGDLADDQLCGIRLQLEVEEPLDVLRSLTCVNADLLRRPDLGRLQVGTAGDLVALDADPLDDPAALWDAGRERQVVIGGVIV